jgi:hypothetical protein
MTRAPKGSSAPETADPVFERPGDAGARRDDIWVIIQQLHEVASDLSRNSTKTDRLVADVEGLSRDVKGLTAALTFARGFGVAAVLLIPLCAGLVWWLVGGKLNEIRDELYRDRLAIYKSPSPMSPQPGERNQR